ncbi:MAG: Ig-like domain-containing protein, partial [Pseudomonadota bacterium]
MDVVSFRSVTYPKFAYNEGESVQHTIVLQRTGDLEGDASIKITLSSIIPYWLDGDDFIGGVVPTQTVALPDGEEFVTTTFLVQTRTDTIIEGTAPRYEEEVVFQLVDGDGVTTPSSLTTRVGARFRDSEGRVTAVADTAETFENDASMTRINVLVNEVNEPPIANGFTIDGFEGQPVHAALFARDPDGDALTYDVVTGPANGTVSITSDGQVVYTPDDGFSGTDSIVYGVSDGRGGADTATVTVSITDVPDTDGLSPRPVFDPSGSAFLAHTPDLQFDHDDPWIVAIGNGRAAVLYEEDTATETRMMLQIVDASGAVGTPTVVDPRSGLDDFDGNVTVLSDGRILVVWESSAPFGQGNGGIWGRVFAADGTPAGGVFDLSDASEAFFPSLRGVEPTEDGFAIEFIRQTDAQGNERAIVLQFDVDEQGGIQKSFTANTEINPSTPTQVVELPNGTLAIVTTSDTSGMLFKVLDPVTGDVVVENTPLVTNLDRPAAQEMQLLADGRLVVVGYSSGDDFPGFAVVLEQDGTEVSLISGDFLIGPNTPAPADVPSLAEIAKDFGGNISANSTDFDVAASPFGGFVVSLRFAIGQEDGGSTGFVVVTRFDENGQPVGESMFLPDLVERNSFSDEAVVSIDDENNLFIVWESYGAPQDAVAESIVQAFELPLVLSLLGDSADNQIYGSAFDEVMEGGLGSDTYVFDAGHGMDRIEEDGGAGDVIELLDVARISEIYDLYRGPQAGSSWEGTLYIETAEDDVIEVKNHFASHGRHLVETLRFSGGDELRMHTGTTGGTTDDLLVGRSVVDFLKGHGGDDVLVAGANDDALRGHADNDILVGQEGDDLLVGGQGADVYVVFSGDEHDTIIEYDGTADLTSTDQLLLSDVDALTDISIARGTSNGSTWEGHLVLSTGASDSVTVLNHFASNGRYVVEQLILAGGETVQMTKETFGGAENDLLVGRSVVDYLKGNGGNDYMLAGANADVIFGHAGDDTLIGEAGDDHLRGGDGADRYVLNAGDGDDLITE